MLTYVGTIIGGGVVGLPIAFYYTGIAFGIIMNLLCALGSVYSVYLLIRAKNITGLSSYSELGYYCYGRASIFLINVLIAGATAGIPIAYFMIFGHICPSILISIGIPDGFFSS
jgi:amino acid permease